MSERADGQSAEGGGEGRLRRLRFRRRQRLSHARDYQAILKGRMSRPSGPLVVHARAGTTGVHRLGLSVGRRVGPAVVRNRIKRRLREAFRHVQHALPRMRAGEALDFVVVVRPHEPLARVEYERLLVMAAVKLVSELDRRAARDASEQERGDGRVRGEGGGA